MHTPGVKLMEKKEERGELVVGLDIGTTKICVVVGEVRQDRVDILGAGTHPSVGLKKGVIVNIESTVNSIRKAVEMAEEALKKGVSDFITKPFRKDSILFTIKRVLELSRVKRENVVLREKLDAVKTK